MRAPIVPSLKQLFRFCLHAQRFRIQVDAQDSAGLLRDGRRRVPERDCEKQDNQFVVEISHALSSACLPYML
jgi:hypothetical protein